MILKIIQECNCGICRIYKVNWGLLFGLFSITNITAYSKPKSERFQQLCKRHIPGRFTKRIWNIQSHWHVPVYFSVTTALNCVATVMYLHCSFSDLYLWPGDAGPWHCVITLNLQGTFTLTLLVNPDLVLLPGAPWPWHCIFVDLYLWPGDAWHWPRGYHHDPCL